MKARIIQIMLGRFPGQILGLDHEGRVWSADLDNMFDGEPRWTAKLEPPDVPRTYPPQEAKP